MQNFEKLTNEFNSITSKLPAITLDLSTSDIFEPSIQDEIDEIIAEAASKTVKKKPIFETSSCDNKDGLRQEARNVKSASNGLDLPTYSELKAQKLANCSLSSYHFFKNLFSKPIAKENNYIFDFRENLLNDMSKIDKAFFSKKFEINSLKDLPVTELELVYEFSIFHPLLNIKTQQIAILGQCSFAELRGKIYCVLSELDVSSPNSFFFIESNFYNQTDNSLSNEIIRNRNLKPQVDFAIPQFYEEAKTEIDSSLYSQVSSVFSMQGKYKEFTMDKTIKETEMRIGYPYLFRHCECCDHVLLLEDVRVIDKFDDFDFGRKSKVTYQKKLKRRVCDVCNLYFAKVMSLNDKIVDNKLKVGLYCQECLERIQEEEKKGNQMLGKLMPYFHDN